MGSSSSRIPPPLVKVGEDLWAPGAEVPRPRCRADRERAERAVREKMYLVDRGNGEGPGGEPYGGGIPGCGPPGGGYPGGGIPPGGPYGGGYPGGEIPPGGPYGGGYPGAETYGGGPYGGAPPHGPQLGGPAHGGQPHRNGPHADAGYSGYYPWLDPARKEAELPRRREYSRRLHACLEYERNRERNLRNWRLDYPPPGMPGFDPMAPPQIQGGPYPPGPGYGVGGQPQIQEGPWAGGYPNAGVDLGRAETPPPDYME